MDSSGYWDQQGTNNPNRSQHEVQSQRELSQDEIRESILLSTTTTTGTGTGTIADQNFHHNHLIHIIDEENSNFGSIREDLNFNHVNIDDDDEDDDEEEDLVKEICVLDNQE